MTLVLEEHPLCIASEEASGEVHRAWAEAHVENLPNTVAVDWVLIARNRSRTVGMAGCDPGEQSLLSTVAVMVRENSSLEGLGGQERSFFVGRARSFFVVELEKSFSGGRWRTGPDVAEPESKFVGVRCEDQTVCR